MRIFHVIPKKLLIVTDFTPKRADHGIALFAGHGADLAELISQPADFAVKLLQLEAKCGIRHVDSSLQTDMVFP